MDKEKLFAQIKGGLIVSCQALEHEPLYTKEGGVMPLMAKAAAMSGAVGIRANTVRDITQIKAVVDLPVIGIIKKDYPGTPMYITVTMKEVDELVACGVDILAVQGTGALRPVLTLWAPRCAATPRRLRASTTSTSHSSTSWPQSARPRSSPRGTSTIPSRPSRHWKPVRSPSWSAVPSPAPLRSRPVSPVPSTP